MQNTLDMSVALPFSQILLLSCNTIPSPIYTHIYIHDGARLFIGDTRLTASCEVEPSKEGEEWRVYNEDMMNKKLTHQGFCLFWEGEGGVVYS